MIVTDKICLIHSPRTAGNSFEHNLEKHSIEFLKFERHTGYQFIKPFIGNQKFYFCMREPFSQLISRYEYALITNLKKRAFYRYTAYRHWINEIWSDDLEQFIKNYINKNIAHISLEFKIIADYRDVNLFKYDNINSEINKIMYENHNIENFYSSMNKKINSNGLITDDMIKKVEYLKADVQRIEQYYYQKYSEC